MKTTLSLFLLALLLGCASLLSAGPRSGTPLRDWRPEARSRERTGALDGDSPQPTAPGRHIQIALLLDTSGSMQNLIAQTKTRLWQLVNELSESKSGQAAPSLEIALYQYGNSNLDVRKDYLRMEQTFTSDFDRVSEKLFSFTTGGGAEYCGAVVDAAHRELNWSQEEGAQKLIVIAGNESIHQGRVRFPEAVAAAARDGIEVQAIYCGSATEGPLDGWSSQSSGLDGDHLSYLDTSLSNLKWTAAPQDAEIERLGAEINRTTIAYGDQGITGSLRQQAQDLNATNNGRGASVQRALAKAKSSYDRSSWDLVTAIQKKKRKIAELDKKRLSGGYAKLNDSQLKEALDSMQRKRAALQQRLSALERQRSAYLRTQASTTDRDETSVISTVVKRIQNKSTLKGSKKK